MASKNILVTGGMGFIGSHLVDELVQRGHRVRIFDNLDPQVHPHGAVPEYANPHAEFIRADIRDRDALKKALAGIEIVFHKAAAVGMGQSQYEIKKFVDINTGGTANLLDILANHEHRVEKLIVAASQTSYGEGLYTCAEHGTQYPGPRPNAQLAQAQWEHQCPVCGTDMSPTPIPEATQRICSAIYAQTKMHQEDMVLNIGRAYKIPSIALRYFNIHGPRQSLSNPYTGVSAIFMSRLKNGNRPVLYEDGKQLRDWSSVHDIVQANMLAMEKSDGDYRAFNVGTGIGISIERVALTLSKILGLEHLTPDINGTYRHGDTRHIIADISKIKKTLGFQPSVNFQRGLEELVAWGRSRTAADGFAKAHRELQQKGLIASR